MCSPTMTLARVLRGMRISPGLPTLLSVSPLLGRGLMPADAESEAPAVVMLSYEAWNVTTVVRRTCSASH
jgi:hypothetical protein